MADILKTIILAMTPIGELRVAIPTALAFYHLSWQTVYFIAVLGNLIPAIFLLWLLSPISNWLCQHSLGWKKFFTWLFQRTEKKHSDFIKKYGWWGLAGFVALPLPFTGAWTGALIAFLTKMPFKKAFSAIAVGVLIAGAIITGLIYLGIGIEEIFGWKTLIIILISIFVVYLMLRWLRKKNKDKISNF